MPKFRHQITQLLGVEPSKYVATNTSATAPVELVNRAMDLIQDSEQLQIERKKLSREIGTVKRAGQPVEPIIEQVASLSSQITELDHSIAECLSQLENDLDGGESDEPLQNAPNHFMAAAYDNRQAKGDDLTISSEQPFPSREWQSYVERHPNSTVYHLSLIHI